MYEEGAPHVAQGVWDLIKERNVPVLGICYGMQVSLLGLGESRGSLTRKRMHGRIIAGS